MVISRLAQRCGLLLAILSAPSFLWAVDATPRIAVNDNRTPAGEWRDGILNVHLELGEGEWHPENEDANALTVYAFGEAGKPLQNPGPLIRVPQGTKIHAWVHNGLKVAATIHGLQERPGEDKDGFTLAAGSTRDVSFQAGAAGTFYYWASTTGSAMAVREALDTQLGGALIVDPPGTIAADRIFVISIWYNGLKFRPGVPQVATINGKSWPYSERPELSLGERVHWRWLNLSGFEHAMHLHGFYFGVDGAGDGERSQAYPEAQRLRAVTRLVEAGHTFEMSWTPDRPGRWLMHCHMMVHMSPTPWPALRESPERIDLGLSRSAIPAPSHIYQHYETSANSGMGGLVLGITVAAGKEKSPPIAWHAERKLRMTIVERNDMAQPRYSVAVRDLAQETSSSPAESPGQLIGPPIVLTRGQPVEIEVVNRTQQPTVIHWHGIELESYYDGVAGWTGSAQQATPPISPGQSFVVRMTPPRAGTFIYHTHWHDRAQIENGIYGPLLVLPPGQTFDPAADKIFLVSLGRFEPFGLTLLINGRPQPFPMQLETGRKYRFRLINIEPDQAHTRVSLRHGGVPVEWRLIAKDGADVPPSLAVLQTAELAVTVGETYDFEYEAHAPQELTLEVLVPGPKVRATQALSFADRIAK